MKFLSIVSLLFFIASCTSPKNGGYGQDDIAVPVEPASEPAPQEQKRQDPPTDESGKFWVLDFKALNVQLAQKTEKITPEEIMRQYYAAEMYTREGNETLEVTQKVLANGNTEVRLIHDFLQDDSVSGVQQIMELQWQKGRWMVVSLKRNWKCWKNRGHQDWSVEACL